MTDLRKAAEMALKVLEHSLGYSNEAQARIRETKEALRQALAQPEQEPIAWVYNGILHEFDPSEFATSEVKPLYTAPPSIETEVLAEREACLKEIDIELDEWGWGNNANIALNNVAAAIRARSEK